VCLGAAGHGRSGCVARTRWASYRRDVCPSRWLESVLRGAQVRSWVLALLG